MSYKLQQERRLETRGPWNAFFWETHETMQVQDAPRPTSDVKDNMRFLWKWSISIGSSSTIEKGSTLVNRQSFDTYLQAISLSKKTERKMGTLKSAYSRVHPDSILPHIQRYLSAQLISRVCCAPPASLTQSLESLVRVSYWQRIWSRSKWYRALKTSSPEVYAGKIW